VKGLNKSGGVFGLTGGSYLHEPVAKPTLILKWECGFCNSEAIDNQAAPTGLFSAIAL
jgi:hypothetical protein